MIKTCKICKHEFTKRTLDQETCCALCLDILKELRHKNYLERTVVKKLIMQKRCYICYETFEADKVTDVTCSKRCSKIYDNSNRKESYNHPAYYQRPIN